MIGRVGLVNFNVTFSLSLVLSSHPPDEPLCRQEVLECITVPAIGPSFTTSLNKLQSGGSVELTTFVKHGFSGFSAVC